MSLFLLNCYSFVIILLLQIKESMSTDCSVLSNESCSSSCYNISPSSDIIYASIGDSFDIVVEHSELLSFNLYKESNGTGVFDIAVCNDSDICVVHTDAAHFEIRNFQPELAGTYEYRYANGTSFCATPFTININECDKVSCYSNQLFPFGFEFGDESNIFIFDDDVIPIQLDAGFIFYNTNYTEVFLGNGYLSFEDPDYFNETFPIQEGFPIDTPLIAPFLSDVFEYSSTRLFRVTTNNDTIQRVREEVASAFPELPTFLATQVLIATWIPDYETQFTYQCILATNGFYSFVFFFYGGDTNTHFLFSQPVVVEAGLNAGNGVDFISLTESLNSNILDIITQSNVGCPGVFTFQVNGVAQQPGIECEQICINTNGSFICNCNPGYQLNEDSMTCSTIVANGSCAALGLDGCCMEGNCLGVGDEVCYCDQICHDWGDCCDDIEEIQCFEDINECLNSSCDQICINTNGSFICECDPGYQLNEDLMTCSVLTDIDECANSSLNGCDQLCSNTIGSFACECNTGYQLNDDLMTCSDINECDDVTTMDNRCHNQVDHFFPFGEETEDILSGLSDDGSVAILLSTGFVFYGTSYMNVFLNNNGDLSFNDPFRNYYPETFPLYTLDPLIAPFWTDLLNGAVWYRITTNNDIIQRVREEVASAFPERTPFSATQVLIATWDNVGYFGNPTSQRATFQCILATNGVQSFVFFLYGDLDVNDLPPQVGLNAGNGVDFISLDGSLTSDIYNINRESNLGCPGVFVFQVDGGIQQPQSKLQCTIPSYAINSVCRNTVGSFVCECNTGYELNEDLLTCSVSQPQVNIDPQSQISVVLGDPLKLECEVTVPKSLNGTISSITWEHRDSNLRQGITTVLSEGKSSLDLGIVVSAEAGVYMCSVLVTSHIHSNLSANNTVTVFVIMTTPSNPIVTPNAIVSQYFSGIEKDFICLFTINSAIDNDPDAVVKTEWRKGDSLITGDSRLSVTTTTKLESTYIAQLQFQYLTQLDSDNYSCDVVITSKVNDGFIKDTSVSSSILINVEGPTPDIILTSSTLRLPIHPDYNQATLICTATLPLPPEIDELVFDKVFTWTMNGINVTSEATLPTDLERIESISTLTQELTNTGDDVFRCEVNVSVPGDPIVSNSSSITITASGPSNPFQPTNITDINVASNEVTIQWTVNSTAYAPETYVVLYGFNESSLTQESNVVNGVMDFNSVNESYSVVIPGLFPKTDYYYQVRSTNTEGSIYSLTNTFTTRTTTEPMIITGPSDANINYGDDVTLTCTVFSDESPMIIWKHMQTSERTRSFLTKPTMTSNNNYLYDCSLMISNVNLTHNGDYFFIVSNTNLNGSKKSETASLSVIVPPPNVIISPGPVNLSYNSTVTLTCVVQSLTIPTVNWTTDTNVTLASTSLVSNNDNNVHNRTLILEQVTLEYIGEYTCTAENEGGDISDMINVDVYVPLPNVIISPGSVNVSYNSTVTLTCIVQSLTTPTVIWTNDTNVNLTSLVSNKDNNIHNSTLILEQVTLEYIGEYTCTAENEGGVISDMINVIVYVPLPNVTISVNILAYSRVNLTCVIQSLTTPTVNWTTNMNVVPPSVVSNHDNNVYTSTLILEQVALEYGEEYTCTAKNEGGEISDTINVDVYVLPVITISPRSVNISYNSTVTLTCEVQSLTISTVNWTTNTNMTIPSSSLISNDDIHTRNVTLKQVTLEYIGEYTCSAENEGGETSAAVIVTVYVPPPNVHITPRSVDAPVNSTVNLTCMVQSLTIPTVNWTTNTNMTLPSTSLVSNNDIHNSTLTLEQVTMEYIGEYTCTGENEGGEMSDMIIVDVDDTETSKQKVTIIVTVTIVIMIIILLLLIVVIIIIKRWRNRVTLRLAEINNNTTYENASCLSSEYLNATVLDEQKEKYIQIRNRVGSVHFRELSSNLISASRVKIIEKIGQGEFGVVYRGILTNETDLNSMPEPVAVKTLKGVFSKSDVDNIVQESLKMKSFDHLNVLPLIGVCLDLGDAPYILTPFMDEGSLLSYLKRERPNLTVSENAEEDIILDTRKQLLSMCLQIANGMMYLAEKTFIHRDLAARNCMISSSGIIKVADFGLSEDIYCTHYYRETSSVKLPIKWMSLESINDGFFNEKTDVWSYGVVCWEVFTLGRMPYPGLSPKEVVELLGTGERLDKPRSSVCSQEIYSVMMRCWFESPDERPCFSELVQSFNHALKPLAHYLDFTQSFTKNET